MGMPIPPLANLGVQWRNMPFSLTLARCLPKPWSLDYVEDLAWFWACAQAFSSFLASWHMIKTCKELATLPNFEALTYAEQEQMGRTHFSSLLMISVWGQCRQALLATIGICSRNLDSNHEWLVLGWEVALSAMKAVAENLNSVFSSALICSVTLDNLDWALSILRLKWGDWLSPYKGLHFIC